MSFDMQRIPHRINWGLEKEQLRVSAEGRLSESNHPPKLKPPRFTRDFAESQLEMVTDVETTIEGVLASLESLTAKAASSIGGEVLWPFSMPPALEEQSIRIADFINNPETGMDEFNAGAKVLYREGLALRYGKFRQMISGIHVNVSLPRSFLESLYKGLTMNFRDFNEFTGELYTGLAGYIYRQAPLLMALGAASPVEEIQDGTRNLCKGSVYSIRNSACGYAGRTYRGFLDLSSLQAYRDGIRKGMQTESSVFHFLGLVRNSRPLQLNTRIFQTESEFYAPVRIRESEKGDRGDFRLEIRTVDLNPYASAGVSPEILNIIHLLIARWFASDEFVRWKSDPHRYMSENSAMLPGVFDRFDALAGGNPLSRDGSEYLGGYAEELSSLYPLASALDSGSGEGRYLERLNRVVSMLNIPSLLPAARLAREFLDSGLSWTEFGTEFGRTSGKETVRIIHHLEEDACEVSC